jgi:hypothetical protein
MSYNNDHNVDLEPVYDSDIDTEELRESLIIADLFVNEETEYEQLQFDDIEDDMNPPNDQPLGEESEAEEPTEEDLTFINDGEAKKDVTFEGKDITEENIIEPPVVDEDEEGPRRSNRKRKIPKFYGLKEEEGYYAQMAEDLVQDCKKYNEKKDGSVKKENIEGEETENEEEEEEEEEDEEGESYMPSDDEVWHEDDEDDDDDSYCPAAKYILLGKNPITQTICFRAIDVEGLIIESSEDCLTDKEKGEAVKSVLGNETLLVCPSEVVAKELFDTFPICDMDCEKAKTLRMTVLSNIISPEDVQHEEWFEEIGEVFFQTYI